MRNFGSYPWNASINATTGITEKQFTDALRVYEVQFARLDLDYLRHWAKRLTVSRTLQRLQQEAQVL